MRARAAPRGRRSAARAARSRARRSCCASPCGASAPTQQASGSTSTARVVVDPVRQRHERAPRHDDALGEDARPVHPDQPPRRAEVVLAREAVRALAAADQRIDGVVGAADPPDDLVPEHERRHARPGMPAVAVQVGAADPGELDLEHDLARRRPPARARPRRRRSACRARRALSSPTSHAAIIGRHRRSTIPPRSPVSCPSRSVCTPFTTTCRMPTASWFGSKVVPRSANALRVEDGHVGARARPQHAAVGRDRAARRAGRSACARRRPGESSRSSLTMKRQNHEAHV